MCNALRKENPHISNRDIRDRVIKDCKDAGLASSTITHNIPLEFKNPNKVKAGKKSAEEKNKKKLVPTTTSGAPRSSEILLDKKDEDSNDWPRNDDDVEKKKILVQIATSGAAETAAENSPESKKKPNLGILEIPWRKEDYVDKEIDESKNWMPKDEDVEFLKKQLSKQIEENRQKDIRIEQLQNEKIQLSEVIKKDSFTPANDYKPILPKKFDFPEPDEYNTFVWKNITFDEFRMKLGPLKARSNSKINVYLERVT